MGRPPGAKNRPGSEKPGRKLGSGKLKSGYTDVQILEFKVQLLELMSSGKASTISDAARQLAIDPVRVHHWASKDKDFQEMLHLCREVIADELEERFRHHANFIPQMMLLKGYRPMFRDTYKTLVTSDKLETLLEELKKIKEPKVEVLKPPEEGEEKKNDTNS